MKIVMKDDKHAWLIIGSEAEHPDEVIVDREVQDVRVRIGKDIVKIQYERKGLRSNLKEILVNDIYVIYH